MSTPISIRTMQSHQIKEEPEDILRNLRVVIALDKSGSMGEKSIRIPGKTKWEELCETVVAVAREVVASKSPYGITLVPFSNAADVKLGLSPEGIESFFRESRVGGGTNLAGAMEEIVSIARHSREDVLAIVYTDGVADNEDAVFAVMNRAGKDLGRPRIGFCIIQVGNDSGAKKFLERIDDSLTVDVSSTVPFADSGDLSFAKIAWLARNA